MPWAHGDCQFRDKWLVQDKYKEWMVKDVDPRLARRQWQLCEIFHAKNANSRMNSLALLLQMVYLRKSESVSGHVPVLFVCCKYHVLDTT